MPRTGQRGGPQTRARIAEIAARLFLERGFDAVTVADVAREAGVSSVTVFNHFPRKEDLFLDRAQDAAELLVSAVRDRAQDVDVLTSLHAMTRHLAETRHPLSGLDDRSIPFFRTVAGSPALVARAREIASDLQATLASELAGDRGFEGVLIASLLNTTQSAQPYERARWLSPQSGVASLFAAFFIAGYGTVLVETARRLIAGEQRSVMADDHCARLDQMFAALRSGIARSHS